MYSRHAFFFQAHQNIPWQLPLERRESPWCYAFVLKQTWQSLSIEATSTKHLTYIHRFLQEINKVPVFFPYFWLCWGNHNQSFGTGHTQRMIAMMSLLWPSFKANVTLFSLHTSYHKPCLPTFFCRSVSVIWLSWRGEYGAAKRERSFRYGRADMLSWII